MLLLLCNIGIAVNDLHHMTGSSLMISRFFHQKEIKTYGTKTPAQSKTKQKFFRRPTMNKRIHARSLNTWSLFVCGKTLMISGLENEGAETMFCLLLAMR